MTLQEFLEDNDDRNKCYKSGKQWSLFWQLAVENIEQGMPNVGEEVITLVSGHSGMGADKRIVDEIIDDYIYLINPDDRRSLVSKSKWYREIVRLEHKTAIDLEPFRGKFYNLVRFIAVGT